jgi:hypothetical protein
LNGNNGVHVFLENSAQRPSIIATHPIQLSRNIFSAINLEDIHIFVQGTSVMFISYPEVDNPDAPCGWGSTPFHLELYVALKYQSLKYMYNRKAI